MVYCGILLPVNEDPVHGGDMLWCDIQCPASQGIASRMQGSANVCLKKEGLLLSIV